MNMKLAAKPLSSPGRTEKFPPPLMRFLRSNVGSRSRGRSRSSPMFVRKKNTTAIETQEPSSPKVTCMGQVRVRRSKLTRPGRAGGPHRRRCKWIKNAFYCHHFPGRLKPRLSRPSWSKWGAYFHVGSSRKSKTREDSSRTESTSANKLNDSMKGTGEESEEEEEEVAVARVFASSSCLPPKNALLLTRCRSAPYRSSSLASRFWGSPLGNEETKEEDTKTEQEYTEEEHPTSERESISRDSDQESKMNQPIADKLSFFKELEESIAKSGKTEAEKTEQTETLRPLILTRCKSEPARTAEKLDPDLSFWKKRRLGFT